LRTTNHLKELLKEFVSLDLICVENTYTFEELLRALALKIEALIEYDFQGLVQLLYKLDVPENKLKELLNQHNYAPKIIATAIIERQLQKIKTRKAYTKINDIPEDERW
jgi:hypothetical protein